MTFREFLQDNDYLIPLMLMGFIAVVVIGITQLLALMHVMGDNKTIDCSNVKYSKNISKTLEIMKYCTGNAGEGE